MKMSENFQTVDLEGPYDSFRKAEIIAIFRTFPVNDMERANSYEKEGNAFWRRGTQSVSIVSRPLNPYFDRDVEMAIACGIPEELMKDICE